MIRRKIFCWEAWEHFVLRIKAVVPTPNDKVEQTTITFTDIAIIFVPYCFVTFVSYLHSTLKLLPAIHRNKLYYDINPWLQVCGTFDRCLLWRHGLVFFYLVLLTVVHYYQARLELRVSRPNLFRYHTLIVGHVSSCFFSTSFSSSLRFFGRFVVAMSKPNSSRWIRPKILLGAAIVSIMALSAVFIHAWRNVPEVVIQDGCELSFANTSTSPYVVPQIRPRVGTKAPSAGTYQLYDQRNCSWRILSITK